jgi:predicted nuclease of predicted toxin-antitoxin system
VNIVADESVDGPIVVRLRQDGHNVSYVAEMSPGVSDDEVLDEANRQRAILLTADKDFGDLIYRQRRTSQGVILIRLAGLSAAAKAQLTAATIDEHSGEIPGAFCVIAANSVRIRRR